MKTHILSYPRSGNSWTRYVAEHLSGRPTRGCEDNELDVPLCTNTMEPNPLAHVRQDEPPVLYKSHTPGGTGLEPGDRILFITRDPATAVRRHKRKLSRDQFRIYTELLETYHDWPGDKLLIKYEELVSEPAKVIRELAAFIDVPAERVDAFMADYEQHKRNSISLYSDPSTGVPAKGKSKTRGRLKSSLINRWASRRYVRRLRREGKAHLCEYFSSVD